MRGSITKRSPGSWMIRIDRGRDDNGKRRQSVVTVRGKKADAEREMRRLLGQLEDQTFVEPDKITVGQYLERWLGTVQASVTKTTFEGYDIICRTHLIPALGAIPLQKLLPIHIADYYARAQAPGYRERQQGLSAQTTKHHHRVLSEALKQAVAWRMVQVNQANFVAPPKPERRKPATFTAAETLVLLEVARRAPVYLPIVLAVTCGMRRGEILGLRWVDVDLEARKLSVVQSLAETREDGTFIKSPKTHRSTRPIALPKVALDALRQQKAQQAALRLKAGPDYQDNGLVITDGTGSPWSPAAFSVAYAGLIRRRGLKRVSFHGLRHSHATQLLSANVHPKIVSERLGHSSIGITLDLYSHALPNLQEEAAAKVDEALTAVPAADHFCR